VEALYVGNHSLHLPVGTQNINATLPQYLTTNPYRDSQLSTAYGTSVTNPYAGLLPNSASCNGATVALSVLLTPYPQFCGSTVAEVNQTIGSSNFNSLILHIEQRKFHGLYMTANYSFSKLLESDTFLNDEDNHLTYRVSPFDHTHHFTAGATYDLPFGRGKLIGGNSPRWVDEIIGGFVINGVFQFQTGAPVVFTNDLALAPGVTPQQITIRPRDTDTATLSKTGTPPGTTGPFALDPTQFVTTANPSSCTGTAAACNGSSLTAGQYTYHLRTLPQTLSSVRQDGFNNLDASLLKNFSFTEKTYLQLRFESFNTLNHPVFASPNVSSATSSNFGQVTAVYSNSTPRQIQIGARIVF
jgi:hypothetical protein